MQSHSCQFTANELARLCYPPLVPILFIAGLIHLSGRAGWLPSPRPTLDLDRTILIHQVEASRKKQDAEVLFLGDSSCLMNLSTVQAAEQLGTPTLNLGTLSYLSLADHARLLEPFMRANPGRPKAVVLLQHPEALRRHMPKRFHTQFLASLVEGTDYADAPTLPERLTRPLGLELLRNRLLSRLLPTPLPGIYGHLYGFTADLDRYMTQQRGSLLDPERLPFAGSAEYFLSAELQNASRAFRQSVPSAHVTLIVGITPIPASYALPGYPEHHAQMLRTWAAWIQADASLHGLPATLPDHCFNSVTHLTQAGVQDYTQRLVHELRPLLNPGFGQGSSPSADSYKRAISSNDSSNRR